MEEGTHDEGWEFFCRICVEDVRLQAKDRANWYRAGERDAVQGEEADRTTSEQHGI